MAERPNINEEYEFFVTDSEFKQASTGTKYTKCTFTIRSDIEQNGKGWNIYHFFWKKKDGSTDQSFTTIEAKFNEAIGLVDDELAKDPEKWAKTIKGKAFRSKLKEEQNNGKTFLGVNVFSFEPSKVAVEDTPPVVSDPFKQVRATDFANFSEDDLPF